MKSNFWSKNNDYLFVWDCECLGILNGDGYGDTCANHDHDSEHEAYCYVNKNACTEEGIEWFESSSTVIDTTSIGYSEELCVCNFNKKTNFVFSFKYSNLDLLDKKLLINTSILLKLFIVVANTNLHHCINWGAGKFCSSIVNLNKYF